PSYTVVLSIFFFQAEDGIRDDLVTGVQTCALPISAEAVLGASCQSEKRKALPRQGAGPQRKLSAAPSLKTADFGRNFPRYTKPRRFRAFLDNRPVLDLVVCSQTLPRMCA